MNCDLGDQHQVPKQPVDEQVITDYLLGAASVAETERLDELSLTDDDFARRLQAAENDLVDAYVRGELAGGALARFNSHYLASPRRRAKVRFAQTFLALVEHSPSAQDADAHETVPASTTAGETASPAAPWWQRSMLPQLQWGFAAVALLMLLTGGYLLWANLRLRAQLAQTQAERVALAQREQELQRQLAQQRLADANVEQELSRVRDRLAQLEQQLATAAPGGRAAIEQRALNVIAFNLAPQTRGTGQLATLDVPAGTDYLALTLTLEVDDFPAYRATLRNPATGQIIWRSGQLKTSGQSKTVRVSPRASLFNSQNYVLELYGISATGAAELVSSYPFRVVRR
jgi:anti-sigma-K factor RskA